MSKFNLYKVTKALDPRAWENELNPARLRQHQDIAWTPYGKVHQRQNQKELEEKYSGVHFAFTPELAALYAENKATKDDPPVLIEIYKQDLPMKADVDAEADESLKYYLIDKKTELQNILNLNIEDKEKIDLIFNDLEDDNMGWQTDGTDLIQEHQTIPPVAISNYLRENQDRILQIVQSLIAGNIPEDLKIAVIGQFRVMHPIISGRVKAIYLIPFVKIDEDMGKDPWEMSDEEIEEEGWQKNDKGEIVDEDGRLIISAESIMYHSWLNMNKIYEDKQMNLPGMEIDDSNTVWHGTTLGRAKQAFPDLLTSIPSTPSIEVEAKSNNWYKTSSGYDWVKNKMKEDNKPLKYPYMAVRLNNFDQFEPIERLIGEWVYAKTESQARAIFYKKHPWLREVSSFYPEYDIDKFEQNLEKQKKKDKKEKDKKDMLLEQIQDAYWNK
jgi:hypothetical protein